MTTQQLEAQLKRLQASRIKMPAIQRAIAEVEAQLAVRYERQRKGI